MIYFFLLLLDLFKKVYLCCIINYLIGKKKVVKMGEFEFNYLYIYLLIILKVVFFLNKKLI